MKAVAWDPEKNSWLRLNRGVSFEEAALKIRSGDVLDIVRHADSGKFSHQRIFILDFSGYAFMVPFVESENEIFLKTIFPSRKATKKYLSGGSEHGQTY